MSTSVASPGRDAASMIDREASQIVIAIEVVATVTRGSLDESASLRAMAGSSSPRTAKSAAAAPSPFFDCLEQDIE